MRGIRHSFSKMYKMSLKCRLECNPTSPQEDTQEHLIICSKLSKGNNLNIQDVFAAEIEKQAAIANLVSPLLRRRKTLLEDQEDSTPSLPGAHIPGPLLKAV